MGIDPRRPEPSDQERLDALLLEGLNSGEPIPADADFWAELKREAMVELKASKKTGK